MHCLHEPPEGYGSGLRKNSMRIGSGFLQLVGDSSAETSPSWTPVGFSSTDIWHMTGARPATWRRARALWGVAWNR